MMDDRNMVIIMEGFLRRGYLWNVATGGATIPQNREVEECRRTHLESSH